MIRIKLNNRALVYGLPKNIREQVKEDLSIMNPAYINAVAHGRRWAANQIDKYLILFKSGKNNISVPIGYLEDVLHYCNKHQLTVDIYDNRVSIPSKINFKGKLRDYQENAVQDVSEYENGVLEAGTGAGKTVMALRLIAGRGENTLIIVHTKDLLEQWVDRCSEFLNIDPSDIGRIGGGRSSIGDIITIGIVNSIYNRKEKLSKLFGQVIVDECHRVSGRTFSDAVDHFYAKYKLGLTATAERRDGLTDLIFWYIGPARHTINKANLEKNGHILTPTFIMRSTSFTSEEDGVSAYSKMLSELTKDLNRNQFICRDIAKVVELGNNYCLIVSDRKEHCYEIQRILKEYHEIESQVLTGSLPPDERQFILENMENPLIPTIATGQLIGEGYDNKNLNAMFLTTPIKFAGRVTQYVGRIMRPAPGKEKPLVYDYVDWDIKTLRKSAHSRMKVYGKNNIIHE